ncbi:MAG: potassium channel family protein [Candidatus Brocadiia bacterium]
MNSIRFRLRFYLALFLVVMAVGTVGFMVVERLPLGEALYFMVVTLATVGYGDISPATTLGRLLAVFLIVMGVGTFLGVVANATELMLTRREQAARMEKLNMVIGAFFSEVGTRLLTVFSDADPELDAIRDRLVVSEEWGDEEFARLRADLAAREYSVEPAKVDLSALRDFLEQKRPFLVRLLENPALLENESFTNLLWGVFHLTEELGHRDDFAALPASDREHLAGDMRRAYGRLVGEWLGYMEHLKGRYPYLFSLAMRTNPFDEDASPVVR